MRAEASEGCEYMVGGMIGEGGQVFPDVKLVVETRR